MKRGLGKAVAPAHATFAYLQPIVLSEVDFPTTLTNEFLPK
jgi:hypothetical protein